MSGNRWPTEAAYAWVEGRDAFCVSFLETTSPEAVLEKMVGRCGTGIVSVAEAQEWASERTRPEFRSVIRAGIVTGWVVSFEADGYQATLPNIIRRISRGSRAIVVFRDVHAHMSFLYAVDGIVVRSFDPLLYEDPTPWDGPPLSEEAGLDFSGQPVASAFACAERLTGVRLTADLLDDHQDWLAVGHHPCHSLPGAGPWAADTARAVRVPCAEDLRRQSIPNRLFWRDDVHDTSALLLAGWIGWVQFLLCCIAAAAAVAAAVAVRTGMGTVFGSYGGLIYVSSHMLVMLTLVIGLMLDRVAKYERSTPTRPARQTPARRVMIGGTDQLDPLNGMPHPGRRVAVMFRSRSPSK